MTGRPARRSALGAACVLGLFVAAPGVGGTPASADEGVAPPSAVQAVEAAPADAPPEVGAAPPGSTPTKPPPRGFLIYLTDGGDPIVVKEYVEEQGNVRFEKFGGWVGIPRDEILKIVPDEPDTSATLPPAPPAPVAA